MDCRMYLQLEGYDACSYCLYNININKNYTIQSLVEKMVKKFLEKEHELGKNYKVYIKPSFQSTISLYTPDTRRNCVAIHGHTCKPEDELKDVLAKAEEGYFKLRPNEKGKKYNFTEMSFDRMPGKIIKGKS